MSDMAKLVQLVLDGLEIKYEVLPGDLDSTAVMIHMDSAGNLTVQPVNVATMMERIAV